MSKLEGLFTEQDNRGYVGRGTAEFPLDDDDDGYNNKVENTILNGIAKALNDVKPEFDGGYTPNDTEKMALQNDLSVWKTCVWSITEYLESINYGHAKIEIFAKACGCSGITEKPVYEYFEDE